VKAEVQYKKSEPEPEIKKHTTMNKFADLEESSDEEEESEKAPAAAPSTPVKSRLTTPVCPGAPVRPLKKKILNWADCESDSDSESD
jgi:hypothetical protein